MAPLLTLERAAELLAMPKRTLKSGRIIWQSFPPMPRSPDAILKKKKIRKQNGRRLHVRLIGVDSRDQFEIFGSANGTFSFTLKWAGVELARIDTGEMHPLPVFPGEQKRYVIGPHVHYFVPGHGLDFAVETDGYSRGDPDGALVFFLQHCRVAYPEGVQGALVFS